MSMEYEQLMRQLQETEDGEPLGNLSFFADEKDRTSDLALASFTDEEGYGRFLDLHQAYEVYLNIKGLDVTLYLSLSDRSYRCSFRKSII